MKKKIRVGNEIKEMTCEEVFIQYKQLLYKMCLKYKNVEPCFDDLFQIASTGLVVAYNKYSNLDFVFSTYLGIVVRNCFLRHYKKQKEEHKCISLNYSVSEDERGNEMTIADTMADTRNYFDEFIEADNFIKVYNNLSSRQKTIISGVKQGKNQETIGKELNVSQVTISRELKKIKLLLKNDRKRGKAIYVKCN